MQVKTKIITQTEEWFSNNSSLDQKVNDFIKDKDFVSVDFDVSPFKKGEFVRYTAFITYQESR